MRVSYPDISTPWSHQLITGLVRGLVKQVRTTDCPCRQSPGWRSRRIAPPNQAKLRLSCRQWHRSQIPGSAVAGSDTSRPPMPPPLPGPVHPDRMRHPRPSDGGVAKERDAAEQESADIEEDRNAQPGPAATAATPSATRAAHARRRSSRRRRALPPEMPPLVIVRFATGGRRSCRPRPGRRHRRRDGVLDCPSRQLRRRTRRRQPPGFTLPAPSPPNPPIPGCFGRRWRPRACPPGRRRRRCGRGGGPQQFLMGRLDLFVRRGWFALFKDLHGHGRRACAGQDTV